MSALPQARQLSKRLLHTDGLRRQAERDQELALRDLLASATADLVREADQATLRALVLMWMLRRTRLAEMINDPNPSIDALKEAIKP